MALSLTTEPIKYIPGPLPGEIAQSHYERLVKFNFGMSFEKTMARIRLSETGKTERRKRSDCNKFIAQACGMTERQYLDRQTLNPIYRLYLQKPSPYVTEQSLYIASTREPHSIRKWSHVMRCPDCDEQTMNDFGLRYLHRIHYIPGIDVCPRHGSELLHAANHNILTWRNEGDPDYAEKVSPEYFEMNFHPVLVRYRELCGRVLDTEVAVDYEKLAARITAELAKRGIVCDKQRGWDQVGNMLIKEIPASWFRRHLCARYLWPERFWELIRTRGFLTILLLSVMYESVEEGVGMIFDIDHLPEVSQIFNQGELLSTTLSRPDCFRNLSDPSVF